MPTLEEIAAACKAAGWLVDTEEDNLHVPSLFLAWDPAENINEPQLESAARSAVLKVAQGSYLEPRWTNRAPGFWVVDALTCTIQKEPWSSTFQRIEVIAQTYTAAWLFALVALHKAGLLNP